MIILAHILVGLVLLSIIAAMVSLVKHIDWEAAWILLLFIHACFAGAGVILAIVWGLDTLVTFYKG